MAKDKLKMSNRRFMIILIPIIVVLFAIMLTVNILMNYFQVVMDFWFGSGDTVITRAEGSESWNADYYGAGSLTRDGVTKDAQQLSEDIMSEGIVMLKNESGALPLDQSKEKEKKVSVFGWSFSHPFYGGTGSNKLDFVDYVTPQAGLENAGFEVNPTLVSAYDEWSKNTTRKGITSVMGVYMGANGWQDVSCDTRPLNEFGSADWDIIEMPMTDDMAAEAAQYSDVALVYLSRQSGEGGDMPVTMGATTFANRGANGSFGYNENKHYLQLSDDEENLLSAVKNAGFEKVVVILNSANVMQIDDLKRDSGVDSVLWIGGPGERGFNSVGKVLSGAVNPSGRTAGIWAADFTADPVFPNFADPEYYNYSNLDVKSKVSTYTNMDKSNTPFSGSFLVQYEEGVYLGYRYYETAHDIGKAGFDYDEAVAYPFGYGLGYSTFSQRILNHSESDGYLNITVEVENTGNVPGKDVVQIYYSAPYGNETTNPVKMEKSSVVLGAFAKTDVIQPDDTDTVTLSFRIEDMASYDDTVNKCYVLDDGTYTISLRNDSHNVAMYNGQAQEFTWTNPTTRIYNDDHDGARQSEIEAQQQYSLDAVPAVNAFDDDLIASEMNKMDMLTRSDGFTAMPSAPDAEDKTGSAELIASYAEYDVSAHQDPDAVMPVTGADNGMRLADMRGVDYDDDAWNTFLDQLTVDEMLDIVRYGYGTRQIDSVSSPQTYAGDSPQCLQSNYWSGVAGSDSALLNAYPCASLVACTWNTELAEDLGISFGNEALMWEINGWYGPGLNIHRSPFGGRNFEYFSEDPLLSGKMCAAEVAGASSRGLNAYLKHFALNDQEEFRQGYLYAAFNGVSTWADEQTIREIYLKPFEIVVKEAKITINYIADDQGNIGTKTINALNTMMSSFNRIGTTWAGACDGLLIQILRDEWGFRGQVMTDFYKGEAQARGHMYMEKEKMIRNGGDTMLATVDEAWEDTASATAVSALRNACHNTFYALANSNAVNDIPPGSIVSKTLAPWQIGLIIGWVVVGLLIAGGIVWIVLRVLDEKKHPEKYKRKEKI